MKNIIFLFSLVIACSSSLAQNQGDIRFGVFGGPSYAGIWGDDFDDEKDDLEDEIEDWNDESNVEASGFYRGRLGFHIGVQAEYFLNDYISLGSAPSYSQKGFSAKLNVENDESNDELKYKLKAKLDYLELPLIATYYLDNGMHLFAGFSTNMLMSDKVEENSESIIDGDSDSDRETDDYDDATGEDLENSVSGLLFGFGINTDIGFINLKFHKTSEWQERDEDYANFTTSVSVGVNF